MRIKINYRDKEELEEFCTTDKPKPMIKNGIPVLFVRCEGIDNEWYIPLCNVLWWEIDYENE